MCTVGVSVWKPKCVISMLSLPRCRFHVAASTLSLFYRGVTFKFLTKILAAALLFYNVCSPSCHYHIIASTLSLPCCCFHVVAIWDLPGFQPRNCTQHGGHVLLADFYNSNFFMSLVIRPLCKFLDFLAAPWQVFKNVVVIQSLSYILTLEGRKS